MAEHFKETFKTLFLSALAVVAPVNKIMVTTFVLIVIELIVDIAIECKKAERTLPCSCQLRKAVNKLFVYEIAILTGYLSEVYLMDSLLPLSKIISTFIGSTELKSIFENLNILNGKPILGNVIESIQINTGKITGQHAEGSAKSPANATDVVK